VGRSCALGELRKRKKIKKKTNGVSIKRKKPRGGARREYKQPNGTKPALEGTVSEEQKAQT